MAITSEIIGKLGGGAGVEEATVEGREITSWKTVVHTVEVPAGKQVLVGFICRFSKIPTLASNWPGIEIGDVSAWGGSTRSDIGISAVITETTDITISAGTGTSSSTLSGGTVYTVKM